MNYFAHARRFLDDPYFVAGTALPDWLGVLDRRVRVRSQSAKGLLDDPDPRVVSLARGIIQHHYDDGWFHQTSTFVELNARLAISLRHELPGDQSLRPGFVGHVAVELLLDAWLAHEAPTQLEDYYKALDAIEPQLVQQTVNRISRVSTDRLVWLVPRFSSEKFLFDYSCDEKLLRRINQVLKRVNLALLPDSLTPWLAQARLEVKSLRSQLLSGESQQPAWDTMTSAEMSRQTLQEIIQ